jgi:methionyl-tRNA formyltransferase
LAARLAEAGAPLMAETLRRLLKGDLVGRSQNHAEATLASMLKREDGRIEWTRPAAEIYNRMRGFAPWPGAYTEFRGRTCHLWGKPVPNGSSEATPGTLLTGKDGFRVVCGGGSQLEITSVKQEGRKQVSAAEFLRGARVQLGERFGTR